MPDADRGSVSVRPMGVTHGPFGPPTTGGWDGFHLDFSGLDFSEADFSGPLARLLLQGLLNSLWQGALVVGLAWLLLCAAGRASAATRRGLAGQPHGDRGAALLAVPAGRPAARRRARDRRPAGQAEARGAGAGAGVAATGLTGALAPLSAIALPEGRGAGDGAPGAGPRARGVAGTGHDHLEQARGALAARRLARGLRGHARANRAELFFLWRIRRRLGLVPSAEREQMRRLTYTFGIRRPLRLFTSPLVSVPMTIGWLRPLVILPHGLRGNLTPTEYAGFYESILAHELGHIKRWDYLTNLLQRLLEAFLFFHPAVWLLGRQLEVERELACDDWAVKLTGGRTATRAA